MRWSSLRPRSKGQALVEFAFVLPILLILILATFQIGLWLGMQAQLSHAAREAAIAGCPADTNVATLLGFVPERVVCESDDGITVVTVSEPVTRISPIPLGVHVTVTGRALERSHESPR